MVVEVEVIEVVVVVGVVDAVEVVASVTSAEEQSKWCKFEWRASENMQRKDVQAASETIVFTGNFGVRFCGFPSLRTTPWRYQEGHFLRSTCPCGPKSGSQTTSEINVQNDITLTIDLTGASADSSLCSPLHDYQEEHGECALISPNLYNSQKSMSNLGIASAGFREIKMT